MQVPNSSGSAQPTLSAPPNACDCHMHIYDGGRFPPPRPELRMQPSACVPDYRLLQQRIGTTRIIVVTPAAYATDNAVTLDAIAQLGAQARGVAVVHPTVTDAELKRLDDARHPRHPLHAVRSENRDHHAGHDRAAGEAGRSRSAGTCRSICATTRSSPPNICSCACRARSCSTISAA